MTAKLKSLKSELKRLTDVGELKKELNRLAREIRTFDLSTAISAERRGRLEKRYRNLRGTVLDLQKRVDSSFEKFAAMIRKNRGTTTTKKTSRKARPASKAKASPSKTAKKTATKKKSPTRSSK